MTQIHRAQAIRNLLAAIILLAFTWWLTGCPFPTGAMKLHHYERMCLLDPSEIVFTCESVEEKKLGDPVMLVGVSPHTVQTSSRSHRLNVWPRNPDSATLVVLPSEVQYQPSMIVALAAVDPPAHAARAQLVIDMTTYGDGKIYTAEGERNREVFLFCLEDLPGPECLLNNLFHTRDLPPYTLDFFSAEGTLLETVTNIKE